MTSNYSVNDLDDFIQTEVLPPNARDAYEADLLDAFGGGGLSETRRGVIIVADRSWSVNRVMKAINAGLHNLCKDIANDPLSAGIVDVALVSFGTDVTVHNLRNGGSVESADYERDIDDIFVPASKVTGDLELKAGGLTSLNQALLTACELEGKYAHRVKKKTLKAPYKTVVVLLTDGHDEPGGATCLRLPIASTSLWSPAKCCSCHLATATIPRTSLPSSAASTACGSSFRTTRARLSPRPLSSSAPACASCPSPVPRVRSASSLRSA